MAGSAGGGRVFGRFSADGGRFDGDAFGFGGALGRCGFCRAVFAHFFGDAFFGEFPLAVFFFLYGRSAGLFLGLLFEEGCLTGFFLCLFFERVWIGGWWFDWFRFRRRSGLWLGRSGFRFERLWLGRIGDRSGLWWFLGLFYLLFGSEEDAKIEEDRFIFNR